LGERAHIAGHTRAGATSPGGSCRLLETADGMLALNLARDDDWDLLSAWLEAEDIADWQHIATALKQRPTSITVERGRLMGLPVCALEPPRREPVPWFTSEAKGTRRLPNTSAAPRVADLSSLWAGPLCSRLLLNAGAQVTKVESATRPDGARLGPPEFFERMNTGKHVLSLDLRSAHGIAELKALIAEADIVIEASRPRALQQLGIDAVEMLSTHPGLTWVSITGYGRQPPQADWVAFGDDAGVAAGLSSVMQAAAGEPLFCGDAIADPLTGMHAALAAWASYQRGGGQLISLPMRDVVTHCIQYDLPESDDAIRRRQQAWYTQIKDDYANTDKG
jgi:crotonobetainyl-CoA:carnitine CoA-transferase CaiB-like acyl-CoA transferase